MKRFPIYLLFSLLMLPNALQADRFYVDQLVIGGNGDGSSWTNAATDLQTVLALARASVGRDTIDVAAGTYKPTTTFDRTATYDMPGGTLIRGGWPSGGGTRQWRSNPSLFSGRLDLNPTEDSLDVYHLFSIIGQGDTVILDGIKLEYGRADGPTADQQRGAAIYVDSSKLVLRNVEINQFRSVGEYAQGGMIYLGNSFMYMYNCKSEGGYTDRGTSNSFDLIGGGILYISPNSEANIQESFLNSGVTGGYGGFCRIDSGRLTMINSFLFGRVDPNYMASGGCLANFSGAVFGENIEMRGRTTFEGGGIILNSDSGFIFINGLSASGGLSGGPGGAILNQSGSRLHLINATLEDNIALGRGGAIANLDSAKAYLTHCTIAKNRSNYINPTGGPTSAATSGGGVYSEGENGVSFTHCIIQDNRAALEVNNLFGDSDSTFRSLNWNIYGRNVNIIQGTNDLVTSGGIDYFRSALEDNLGPSWTKAETHAFIYQNLAKTLRFGEDLDGNINFNALSAVNTGAEPDSLANLISKLNFFIANDLVHTGHSPSPFLFSGQNFINYAPFMEKDQRGVDRDSIPDIGAYEHTEVSIIAPTFNNMCLNDTVDLDPILIQDPSGGAMMPGSGQSIILEIPPGFELIPDEGQILADIIDPQGRSSLNITGFDIKDNLILFSYNKSFEAIPNGISIEGLKMIALDPLATDPIVRIGGSALQLGNELYELDFALLEAGPGPRPDPGLTIDSEIACAGAEVDFSFSGGPQDYMHWRLAFPDGRVDSSFSQNWFHDFYAGEGYDYPVELLAGPDSVCTTRYNSEIKVLEYIVPSLQQDSSYMDNFENQTLANLWYTDAEGSLNSWALGIPNGNAIGDAYSGSQAWVTNLTGDYESYERSYLNSPCFSLDSLERPTLSFFHYTEIEPGFDGFSLEFRTESTDWQTLGIDDTALRKDLPLNFSSGFNWFNQGETDAAPGVSESSWGGYYGRWEESRIRLDIIADSFPGETFRFRFAFASDDFFEEEGVGIDDFSIASQEDKVLVEQFGNGNGLLNAALNPEDMIVVEYPEVDLYFDLDVRALLYGIQSTPHQVIDGTYFIYDGAEPTVGPDIQLLRRTAKPHWVSASINMDTTQIELRSDYDFPNAVDVLVLTGELIRPGIFAARNMIPNVVGISIADFRAGNSILLSIDQRDADRPIPPTQALDASMARALVMVQDAQSKEVYYSKLFEVSALTRRGTGREGIQPGGAVSMRVYPNPTTDLVQVTLDHQPETPYHWSMTDMAGRAVAQGNWKPGNYHQIIQTSQLSAGVYYLHVPLRNGQILQQKISVLR